MNVIVYTDGSCWPTNGGPGGWAAILLYEGQEHTVQGNQRNTTNNRMEIVAVLEGLRALVVPCKVVVFCDSQYVVRSIGTWEKGTPHWINTGYMAGWIQTAYNGKKNVDLWMQIEQEVRRHTRVETVWLKGHKGNEYNERCDKLAGKQRKLLPQKKKSGTIRKG